MLFELAVGCGYRGGAEWNFGGFRVEINGMGRADSLILSEFAPAQIFLR